jgi:hypothetical protein
VGPWRDIDALNIIPAQDFQALIARHFAVGLVMEPMRTPPARVCGNIGGKDSTGGARYQQFFAGFPSGGGVDCCSLGANLTSIHIFFDFVNGFGV